MGQNKNKKCRQRKEALGIQGTESEVEGAASARTPYPRGKEMNLAYSRTGVRARVTGVK